MISFNNPTLEGRKVGTATEYEGVVPRSGHDDHRFSIMMRAIPRCRKGATASNKPVPEGIPAVLIAPW